MAIIRSFKETLGPTRDKVNLVASRSYLSYSDETLKEKLDNNPYTFLHIINPNNKKSEKNSETEKYKLIKKKFKEFVDDGVLLEENEECLYIYQQTKEKEHLYWNNCAASIDDYINGNIKIHEQTLTKREELFKDYLKNTGFNSEPVLLTYQDNNRINSIVQKKIKERSEYEFTTTNKVLHKFWILNNKDKINTIVEEFKKIQDIYIADDIIDQRHLTYYVKT